MFPSGAEEPASGSDGVSRSALFTALQIPPALLTERPEEPVWVSVEAVAVVSCLHQEVFTPLLGAVGESVTPDTLGAADEVGARGTGQETLLGLRTAYQT